VSFFATVNIWGKLPLCEKPVEDPPMKEGKIWRKVYSKLRGSPNPRCLGKGNLSMSPQIKGFREPRGVIQGKKVPGKKPILSPPIGSTS